MVDLNALIVFVKVADSKSFSAAAQSLKMPLSTVSRRIAELEAHLGVRLLERSTRALRLTEIGADILLHARRGKEIGEAIADIVADRLAHVRGTLRLSASPYIVGTLIAPLVFSFQRLHPGMRFEVDVTEREVDLVADGVDFAFRRRSTRDSALIAVKILGHRPRLVASRLYVSDGSAIARPSDLLRHRLLAFTGQHAETSWTFIRVDGRGEEILSFRPYIASNDYAALVPALLNGIGIGVLPPIFQPELLREGRLVEVMPEWRLRQEDLMLVHLGGRHMPRPARVFKEFAVKETPGLLPDLST